MISESHMVTGKTDIKSTFPEVVQLSYFVQVVHSHRNKIRKSLPTDQK